MTLPTAVPASMRAVRLERPGQPVVMQTVPVPTIGAHEVLVRVRAAGICHSDVHYRAGRSRVEPLPLTLGHEVAGDVVAVGSAVTTRAPGDRVCLHYLVICGACDHCRAGREQFCPTGLMLGHFTDGGWAEYIVVPERNAVRLPDSVSYEHGAVMMCSSSTSLHALRKARCAAGDRVLIVGAGGLGLSAIQIARELGATQVIAADRDPNKLALAQKLGAIPLDTTGMSPGDASDAVRALTAQQGVNVAIELVGHEDTVQLALKSVAPLGRAVVVGLNDRAVAVDTYRDLIGREAELVGSNDHLLSELEELTAMAARGVLVLDEVVTNRIALDARAINDVLDALEAHRAPARTVVIP